VQKKRKELSGLTLSKEETYDVMNCDEDAVAALVERMHRVLVKGGVLPADPRCVASQESEGRWALFPQAVWGSRCAGS
jgi:hypothetical protein